MTAAPAAPRPPRALKVNFAINVAGALIPLAVSLVTVPIYIRHIGDARYGVLSIVWVLLGYFGFLDLGLSRAAANALARLRDAPQEARASVLVTTLVLNLGMGLVGSLALALAGSYLLQHVLNVPDALKPEIASAFPWIVALFPLALVSGVGIGALESREEFLRANILQVVGTSLGQIVPVLLAVGAGPSLAVVIPAAAAVRGLFAGIIVATVWSQERPLSFSHFDPQKVRGLLKYGGWVSVSGALGPIFATIDQIVIGTILGVESVTQYAVPMNLVLRSQIVPGAMTRTLFPRFSQHSHLEGKYLASRALLLLAVGYGLVICLSVNLIKPFFAAWLGSAFTHDAVTVGQILLIGAWIGGIGWVPSAFANAQNRPELQAKLQLVEILPFALVLMWATRAFGVLGAATVWTARSTCEGVVMCCITGIASRDFFLLVFYVLILISSGIFMSSYFELGISGSGLSALIFCFFIAAIIVFVPDALDSTTGRQIRQLGTRLAASLK